MSEEDSEVDGVECGGSEGGGGGGGFDSEMEVEMEEDELVDSDIPEEELDPVPEMELELGDPERLESVAEETVLGLGPGAPL